MRVSTAGRSKSFKIQSIAFGHTSSERPATHAMHNAILIFDRRAGMA